MKQRHYVHHVNPVTGIECTTRIVVTDKDVTLWQVDKKIDSEPMFDCIDSSEMGMISMPHEAYLETFKRYLEASAKLRINTLEEDD